MVSQHQMEHPARTAATHRPMLALRPTRTAATHRPMLALRPTRTAATHRPMLALRPARTAATCCPMLALHPLAWLVGVAPAALRSNLLGSKDLRNLTRCWHLPSPDGRMQGSGAGSTLAALTPSDGTPTR